MYTFFLEQGIWMLRNECMNWLSYTNNHSYFYFCLKYYEVFSFHAAQQTLSSPQKLIVIQNKATQTQLQCI